ncbi:ABC transporter substrate-binding protein [Qingshengfaniella alkalisoli]
MRVLHKLLPTIALVMGWSSLWAEPLPVIHVGVLETGTVNWEMKTIQSRGLDEANGFRLEVLGLADGAATRIALAGDATDVIVTDWIWAARQRAEGKEYVAFPYSKAVGGILVPESSDAQALVDIKTGKIGIAGGPLDKNWLLLRAFGIQEHGFDIAETSEQVFGAPPLIYKTGISGKTDAAVNFWHFTAKMQAAGMRELVSVSEAARSLGLDPNTPLLVYLLKEDFAAAHPELVVGLYRASREAKIILTTDEQVWNDLRPLMNAANDTEFRSLRDGFVEGIPPPGNVDETAAARMLNLLAELGGEDLVGRANELPEGLFLRLPH